MQHRAFTFIEVMAVVALLGLLAGATAWSLTEDVRRSSRANVVGQIIHADEMARLAARRLGTQCVLRFDLNRQHVRRLTTDEESQSSASHVLKMPAGYRIDRIVISHAGDQSETSGNLETTAAKFDSGTVNITYSTHGRSRTYALRLNGADDGWLLFCGLTGQVTFIDDEDEIDNLFAMLSAGPDKGSLRDRPDAD